MSEILTLFGLGAGFSLIVLVFVLWTVFWKGWALWIAARKGEMWWFLAILIVNTAGILEIVYLFFFKKMIFNFQTKKFEEQTEKVSEVKKEENIKTEPVVETTYEPIKEEKTESQNQ
jgi:flagellar basal body-associated protein FliL